MASSFNHWQRLRIRLAMVRLPCATIEKIVRFVNLAQPAKFMCSRLFSQERRIRLADSSCMLEHHQQIAESGGIKGSPFTIFEFHTLESSRD
eukprot:750386-Hanusia_phi.AAC.6